MKTLNLELNSNQELKFKLEESKKLSENPTMRFLIEDPNGQAFVFPVKQLENGLISVQIPSMKKHIAENTSYTGRLEIIVGNYYFNPISAPIQFMTKQIQEAKKQLVLNCSSEKIQANLVENSALSALEDIDDEMLSELLKNVELEIDDSAQKQKAPKAYSTPGAKAIKKPRNEIIELKVPNKKEKLKPKLKVV